MNKKSKGKSLIRSIMCLIAGSITFCGLIVASTKLSNTTLKEKVVICKTTLTKGTEITESNKSNYFELVDLDVNLITNIYIQKIEDIPSGLLNCDMDNQDFLYKRNITNKSDIADYITDDCISMSIKVSDISDAVGGSIRQGDLINVGVVFSKDKSYNLIYENIYVEKVLNSSGEEVTDDSGSATTIILTVTPDMAQSIYENISKGTAKITKVYQ